jgi:hypothetical protein
MTRKLFSGLLLTVSLTAFIACGNSNDKKDKTETATTDSGKKYEGGGANAGGNAADCGTTAITFGTDKIKSDGFTMKYSEAVLWNMASGQTKYPSIIIQVSNYEKEGSYLQAPTGDNVRVLFSFNGKAGEKLRTGDYDATADSYGGGFGTTGGLENKDGNQGFYNAKGKATITYLGEDKVCGTIDITGGTTFIKGTFSIPLTKSPY